MTTVLGCMFHQAAAIKYNLVPTELLFLDWLILYVSRTNTFVLNSSGNFFEINCNDVLADLPLLFTNRQQVELVLHKLSSPINSNTNKPLQYKIESDSTDSAKNAKYFAFNEQVMDELKGDA
jgi:hypothetical protein